MVRGILLDAGRSLGRTQLSVRLLIAPASGFSSLGFFIPQAPKAPCGITALRSKNPLARCLVNFQRLKLVRKEGKKEC